MKWLYILVAVFIIGFVFVRCDNQAKEVKVIEAPYATYTTDNGQQIQVNQLVIAKEDLPESKPKERPSNLIPGFIIALCFFFISLMATSNRGNWS